MGLSKKRIINENLPTFSIENQPKRSAIFSLLHPMDDHPGFSSTANHPWIQVIHVWPNGWTIVWGSPSRMHECWWVPWAEALHERILREGERFLGWSGCVKGIYREYPYIGGGNFLRFLDGIFTPHVWGRFEPILTSIFLKWVGEKPPTIVVLREIYPGSSSQCVKIAPFHQQKPSNRLQKTCLEDAGM